MNGGSALNVLLVDRDPALRASVCQRLREEGIAVVESTDADSAMALIESGELLIDVVVTDIGRKPEHDGFFLAHWIRKRHPQVAVAVASGSVGFFSAASQLADGAAFVEKPYDVDQLILFLQELVQERSASVA